jgi:hypothetical protein
VSRCGVRAPVWIALAASAALLAGAVAVTLSGETPGERSPRAASARRAPEKLKAARTVALPHRAAKMIAARVRPTEGGAGSEPPALPAAEPIREDRRNPSLVGLEREAAGLAEAGGLLDPVQLEAHLASLPRGAGESPADFARRMEAQRDRLGSEALLLERRLAELYETTVYPIGFPVEQVVAAQERQWIASLPDADREEMLRNALTEREVRPAEPRFEAPESGHYWQAAPPGL